MVERPVVFITDELARRITGEKISFIEPKCEFPFQVRKRIRLIPVNSREGTRIVYGFICDYVTLILKDKYENINVSFAVDKKGELYGGYPALMPAVAINNVF